MKHFYSPQKSNKIFKKAHSVFCSLILVDDLCSREITVADGGLKLGCFRKDFLFGGQLQSFTRVHACLCSCTWGCMYVIVSGLMLKLLCGLQLLSLFSTQPAGMFYTHVYLNTHTHARALTHLWIPILSPPLWCALSFLLSQFAASGLNKHSPLFLPPSLYIFPWD